MVYKRPGPRYALSMEYRRLGPTGLKLSSLSFGSWVTFGTQVDDGKALTLLELAYEAGINFFDNAEVYAQGESEEIMGKALAKLGWGRDTYCISSKVFWGGKRPTQRGLSRKHVFDACHSALKRMRVDYLDLYFCHRPDIQTPIEETVRAMHDLITQGKVLYWGTSEWSAAQIMEAHSVARQLHLHPPVMEQSQYNMFHRERIEAEYHPLYESVGLGTTIWSPLASGVLTGKYNDGIPEDSRLNLPGYAWLRSRVESEVGKMQIEKTKTLGKLAKEMEIPLAQLAIAWCLKNPRVSTVILGASREEQLRENLEALEAVEELTPEVMEFIEKVLQNKPMQPPDFLEM